MYIEWRCNQCVFPPKSCKELTQWDLVPLGTNLILITGNDLQTLTIKTLMTLISRKVFSHQTLIRISQNILFCVMFINQFSLNILLLTLLKQILTRINRKILGWFTWIHSINLWCRVHPHNWNPHHNLPKTRGGSKYACPVYIRPTHNVQSHPRTSFRTNES